jgi:hypothetical protein
MSVFERITKEIRLGMEMYTPVKKKPFWINLVDVEKKMVYFSAGKELIRIPVGAKTPIHIPKCCFDGIPSFLRGKDRVMIGPKYGSAPRGSLQEYLDSFRSQGKSNTSDANYVASVLEHLGIVEIDRRNSPSRVKLLFSSTEK